MHHLLFYNLIKADTYSNINDVTLSWYNED